MTHPQITLTVFIAETAIAALAACILLFRWLRWLGQGKRARRRYSTREEMN